MELLCRCLERAARRSGYSVQEGRRAIGQMMTAPVLQTGPHCLLLIEPDAFYTHLFSVLGLNAHQHEWYLSYHSSTVSFSEKAKKGPGWVRLDGEALNVFGLPRRRMDSFSMCGSNGPYRFAFSNALGVSAPNRSASQLLAVLPSGEFRSAADAIRHANQILWRRDLPSPIKLLQLDDFDIADLIADHLDDTSSWMAAHFVGNGAVPESVLGATDRLNAGCWKGWVRRTTDFFWRLDKGRIVPLRLCSGVLKAKSASNFEVRYIPQEIAEALRRRELVPSLYTVFLVTSVLPGVRVLGGCRQVVYYPLMRHLAAIGFAQSGELGLLADLRSDDRPGLWGHRVLKPLGTNPSAETSALTDATRLLRQYAETPLVQAAGDLASFTRDPDWAHLSQYLADGLAPSHSSEWRWAGS
ncbi:hypothetical protein [Ensifer sp. 4252]|uniref:hypothetical protein n=1 Tax=Ensifer sp. 4252 TaxID=3373915 RepID=UPI003D260E1D